MHTYDDNKVLQKLPDTFSVFRGLQINGPWDVDFIVVGPTGVFTIEAKSHKGKIGFDGSQLTHNGYRFSEKDILKQAMTQAWDTHNYLQKSIGQDIFVKPIIVFARAKTRFGMKPINNVSVIQTQWLGEMVMGSYHKPFDYELVAESLRSLVEIPKVDIIPENSKSFLIFLQLRVLNSPKRGSRFLALFCNVFFDTQIGFRTMLLNSINVI